MRAMPRTRCGLHFTPPRPVWLEDHLRCSEKPAAPREDSSTVEPSVKREQRDRMAVHVWLALLMFSVTYHCVAQGGELK